MPYSFIVGPVNEDRCMGDTLVDTINPNFENLDTGLAAASAQVISLNSNYNTLNTKLNTVSSQDTIFKNQLNTLIQTLTSFAASGTTYTTLSTSFRSLSSLILP